ncbi:MAG: cation transporter [Nocardioides sp.]
MPPTRTVGGDRRRQLGRRAQLLAGASASYNFIEAAIAIAAGAAASSIALVGFGLDSLVEVGSGLVILWQFRHPLPETREKQALRLIAFSFFALAAYVTIESTRSLLTHSEPDRSVLGIGIAAASLAVMPFLSWAQRRTGRELGSGSVVADSKQTLLCTYLSAVLLVGLLANATLGWWWADPIAGLIIAAVAVREGIEAFKGENCGCGPVGTAIPANADAYGDNCDDTIPAESAAAAVSDEVCTDGCCTTSPPGATTSVATRPLAPLSNITTAGSAKTKEH